MAINLIYFGGPHGSGKSTLVKELVKEHPIFFSPELYARNVKFNTEPAYRQILKIASRAIENFEYREIARRNPVKIILGNRCVYDVIAYTQAYRDLGWATPKEYERMLDLAKICFQGDNAEPLAVILNPGPEVIQKHLEQRWKEKGKKWREENPEYGQAACKAYEELRGREKILYLDQEIDLEKRLEIKMVKEWIFGKTGN